MAKQIEDIIVKLGIQGFEGLDKIRSSFRDLSKVTSMSERDITSVRAALFDFAKTAGNTEAVNKGLISAFQGLRTQADLCGAAYTELSRDIADLEAASRGYTAQAVAQRASLSAQYGAITNNTEALRRQRTALIELQQATRGGSQLFTQLGTDIQRTTTRLEEIEGIQRRTNATLTRGLPSSSAKIRRDLQDVRDRISLEQAELERLQTLTAAERRQFSQGTELRGQSGVTRAIAEQERILATFRQQAGALDLSENIRQRREAVRNANAVFMSPEFLTGSRSVENINSTFGDLPNTLAGINQGLSELRNRLDNTTIGTTAFTDAAIRAAAAQRELREATQGVAAAFVQQLRTGEIAPSLTNLREVIASVRTEQGLLDTSTSNDARAFRLLELQARSLERQLSALQTTQASLAATPASGFAAFSQSITPQEGDKAVQGSIRRNRGYQERERVRLEREFVASLTDFEASYAGALDNLLSAKLNFRQQEAKQLELADAKEEEAHQAQMARIRAEAAAEEQQFKREMQRLDLLAQQQKAAASALGLGGRELSPLYQGITNLASASVRREQSMMGRSATQVLTDVFTAFDKGGRDVNIRQKSTQIGESIAQGITAGAVDAKTLNTGANKLSLDFIAALKRAFNIKSPSGESRDQIGVPIGQGIGKGIVKGLNEVRKEVIGAVRLLLSDITAVPQRAALPIQQTALSDKLQSFLARSSARTSTFLPFTRLMGEEAVSSPALTLATYRRSYERGGITPPMYLPIEKRRSLRGVPGLPGYGLEQEIIAAAVRNVGRTGAFVGPLSSPPVLRLTGAPSSSVQTAGFSVGRGPSRTALAGQLAPLFAASSPVPARGPLRYGMAGRDVFPVEGMLGGGRSLGFGRKEAITSVRESINSYRKAVTNFWEGETGTFETVRRVVSSGIQLSASRLAKRLTDTVELPSFATIKGRVEGMLGGGRSLGFGRKEAITSVRESINSYRKAVTNFWEIETALPSLPRRTDVPAPTTANLTLPSGFPVKGMLGVGRSLGFGRKEAITSVRESINSYRKAVTNFWGGMAYVGGVSAGGGSFVPMAGEGGGRGGRTGTPPPAAAPIPPSAPSEYDKLTAAVTRFGSVSKRSTEDLREFSSSLRGLQDILSPTAADFKQVNQIIEQHGQLVDRELEKRQNRGTKRLSGMQLAQGVGAALSGGIFGGPEGLLGGLGGLALGGVGGAFAGAAAGAQVGMFRQQLGTVTDYSARIDKLQIALRGIVGSQDAYSQALAAAASVTRDLNIPQEVAIQGMTRLSAAVKGAGGMVSDSAFAFRAVSEAVKATGGNAEQADGALLALTQVFSKGKVSAEELNQIAERLPGTFTLFAKAAGMTGPELQKALQGGQVGLNDLMKFLQLISTKYGQTALQIAASSQEAGARLKTAFDSMNYNVGRALQPLGAQLQDAFANFITNITPALVVGVKVIGAGIEGMYKAFAAGFNIIKTMRGLIEGLAKTMLVFGGISAGVFVASNITTFANALKGVVVALRAMLTVEKMLLVIENARIAAQAIIAGLTAGATKGKILGAILGGATGIGAVIGIGKLVEGVIGDIEKGLSGALKGADLKLPALTKFSLPSTADDKEAKAPAREREKAADEALRQQTSINKLLQEQVRLNYEAGAIDADALSKLDAEEKLLKEIIRLRINEVYLTSKTQKERALGVVNLETEFTKERKRIQKQRAEILEEIKGLGKDIKKEWSSLTGAFIQESPIQAGLRKFEEERAAFIDRRDAEMKQLRERAGLRPEAATKLAELGGAKAAAQDITGKQAVGIVSRQILQDDIRTLQSDIQTLQSGTNTMGTLGEIMQRHRDYWYQLDEGQRKYIENLAEIKDSLRFMQDMRIGAGFQEGAQAYIQSIGTMREATSQLAQTGIKGVEDAIFSLTTTGTANFQEFAKSILENTARMIIQQLILRSVMQIIGAIGGGPKLAAGAGQVSSFNAAAAQYMPNALGNAYAANGIQPFAMGGIVKRPTMFAFANGGAGRLGLMGEAGPEAIMPLRRLPNGRLGVEQAGGGTPVTVNVSVDASGTAVQGDAGQGEQLGRVVAQAVQAELIKQRRPGGLLNR